MDYRAILNEIKKFSKSDLDIAELEDSTIFVAKNFIQTLKNTEHGRDQRELINELFLECIKHLKNMCTKGATLQNMIVNTTGMLQSLKDVVNGKLNEFMENLDLKCFQLVANLCVKNEWSQEKVWLTMSDVITKKFEGDDSSFVNVAAMIVYNIILGKTSHIDQHQVVITCLNHFKSFLQTPTNPLPDFVSILMDFLFCKSSDALETFIQLDPENQKTALYYIHDYIEDESNEPINIALLQHFAAEFKKKSDCILKTVSSYVDSIDPHIVVSLLDIIALATGLERYHQHVKDDRSLFLNLGCLLQALHKIGKSEGTIFTPIQKLDALVPTSDVSGEFEKEISYSIKTKLVKSLANLSHQNKKNQELAREMEIMLSIFECTNSDARNPMIKEWSILAIRNLCEGNPENQEIVQNMTKVGDAENPLLKEMGLESGILRIGKQ